MILEQYYIECLSHASYLVGDHTTGRAVVIDPRRDVSEYLADARRFGLTIEGVINTHFHADFVSGHLELVDATGGWIGFGEAAETDYPIRRLADGEHVSLGEVDLEIVSTPDTPGNRSACSFASALRWSPWRCSPVIRCSSATSAGRIWSTLATALPTIWPERCITPSTTNS